MSIRFPDLQVLFPRASDVARAQQLMQRHPTLTQEQQAATDQAVREREAQRARKSEADERVRYEQERDGSRRDAREDRRRSSDGEDAAGSAGPEGDKAGATDRRSAEGGPGRRVDVRV